MSVAPTSQPGMGRTAPIRRVPLFGECEPEMSVPASQGIMIWRGFVVSTRSVCLWSSDRARGVAMKIAQAKKPEAKTGPCVDVQAFRTQAEGLQSFRPLRVNLDGGLGVRWRRRPCPPLARLLVRWILQYNRITRKNSVSDGISFDFWSMCLLFGLELL